MRVLVSLFFLVILIAVLPSTSVCAIYGYIDENGVFTITNTQPQGREYRVVVREREDARNDPAPVQEENDAYDHLINQHARTHGIDPCLVKAVMIAESRGNPNAISRKGAQGLMQIMPDTARILDLKHPFDPSENIEAGVRYLKQLYERFTGNLELVLAAYNAGPEKVIESNMAVPRINETVHYIKKVRQYYDRLKESGETRRPL